MEIVLSEGTIRTSGPVDHFLLVVARSSLVQSENLRPGDVKLDVVCVLSALIPSGKCMYIISWRVFLQLKKEGNKERWIAARFDNELPPSFVLGRNNNIGGHVNRKLEEGLEYVVFVAARLRDEPVRANSGPVTTAYKIGIIHGVLFLNFRVT